MSGYVDAHGHLGEHGPFCVPRGGAAELVRHMDTLGVERLVLSSHAAFASDYRWGNDQAAAAAAAHPGRIFFYAVANPNYPAETAAELDRCASRPGFVGVKLHPAVHRCGLEAPGYEPAWAWAAKRGCPVLTHFWVGDERCGPASVRRSAGRWSGIALILAHLGGVENAWREVLKLAGEFPDLWFDTCGSRHPRGMVERLVAGGLAPRLLYGSDMPFIDPGSQFGKILYADIPDDVRAAILGGNARRLFDWR